MTEVVLAAVTRVFVFVFLFAVKHVALRRGGGRTRVVEEDSSAIEKDK